MVSEMVGSVGLTLNLAMGRVDFTMRAPFGDGTHA
jgi:hypothetical protein